MLYFLKHAAYFCSYLDEVMCAVEEIKGLVIKDWYFSGRMETISTKMKSNNVAVATLPNLYLPT